jgi:hypothetical protein
LSLQASAHAVAVAVRFSFSRSAHGASRACIEDKQFPCYGDAKLPLVQYYNI